MSPTVTGIEHHKIEPITKHLSHCKINQSSSPNQINEGLLPVLSCNSHKHISPSTNFVVNTPKPTRGGTRCTYREVLCNGFDLAMLNPSDRWGHDTHCMIAIQGKKMGFIHTWVYLVYTMSSCLRRYFVLYELNTLDACWIAVDVWSNSSRCRQESVYLSRTWCLYMIIALDIVIIICFSINFPTVICLPIGCYFQERSL